MRFGVLATSPLGTDQVYLLCAAAMALVMVTLARRAGGEGYLRSCLPSLNIALLLASVALVLLAAFVPALPLICAAFVVCGAAAGVFQVVWGLRFSCFDIDTALFATPFAAVVTGLVFVALPVSGNLVLFASLPLLSLMFLYWDRLFRVGATDIRVAPVGPASAAARLSRRDFVKLVVSIGIFSFVVRLLDALPAVETAYLHLPGDFTYWALVIVGLVFITLVALFRTSFKPLTVYRLFMPIMVAGFVALSFSIEAASALAVFVICLGYELFDLLFWVILTDTSQRCPEHALRVFAEGTAGIFVGMALGRLVGRLMVSDFTDGGLSLALVSVICIIVLILVVVLVIPHDLMSRFSIAPGGTLSTAAAADDLPARCHEVAEDHRLTPREEEVLMLLARGRTLAVIARELQIATGTARTHIGNIYAKLGVHRQQELIDLVERYGG